MQGKHVAFLIGFLVAWGLAHFTALPVVGKSK